MCRYGELGVGDGDCDMVDLSEWCVVVLFILFFEVNVVEYFWLFFVLFG